MVSSASENTEGLPLPTHFPSGLQHFLTDEVWRCEWKSLLPVMAHKAASGGLAVYGGSSPAEEAGDGKTDWTGSCLGFQAFLLSANVRGGRDPPTEGDQLT